MAPGGRAEVAASPLVSLSSCFSFCLTSVRAEGPQGGSSTGGEVRWFGVWKGRTDKLGWGNLKIEVIPPAGLLLNKHLH